MILGINTSHDSSFCILDAVGHPLYLLEEERFNRIRHTGFGTTLALDFLIRDGQIDPTKVTDLVYSFEMDPKEETRLMQRCYENVARSFGSETLNEVSQYFHQPEHSFSPILGLGPSRDFDMTMQRLRELFPYARESSYKHHLTHAASAFYPSPFETSAIIVADGSGRLETTTLWHGTGTNVTQIRQTELPHSLGVLYWLFSHFLNLEEGQTMGLAAYGRPVYRDLIFDSIIHINTDWGFEFKLPIVFWFDMDNEYATRIIEGVLGAKARHSSAQPLTQFHADVAASIQLVTEDVLLILAMQAHTITGESRVCLAGGIYQNCVANGRLVREGPFSEAWFQPMANDSGTALGAALYHFHHGNPHVSTRWRMTTAQLGIDYDPKQTEHYLTQLSIPFRKSASPAQEAARWLADGQVVAWFHGKAEVGPRALGGRSLLADPRHRFQHFRVNEIKNRQSWRPLAPSIVAERVTEFVESAVPSPYMIVNFILQEAKRDAIAAVSHVDGSARIQTVDRETNTAYYDLLSEFSRETGTPLLLNTSLNLRSEPIVQHPIEAIRNFLLTGIDRLVIDGFILERKPMVDSALEAALAASRFVALYASLLDGASSVIFLDHLNLTDDEVRRKKTLHTLFDWLKINYQSTLTSSIGELVADARDQSLHLVSIAPCLDSLVLGGLPNELHRLKLSVVDHTMSMTTTTVATLLNIIERNRRELHRLIGDRKVLLWAGQRDGDEIGKVLELLGVTIADRILDVNEVPSKPLADLTYTFFVVASHTVADKHKADLRRHGYYPGLDYVVWDT